MGDVTGTYWTVVITGASSGIGLAAATELARRGHSVVLVGRDPHRLSEAVERVRRAGDGRTPDAYRADFTALDEVRALGKRLREAYPRIDVLANNAGMMSHHRSVTVDGFELTIQVNHLAGFLLTHLLLDRLGSGSRVIMTTSAMERRGAIDPDDLSASRRPYSKWTAYASSKQANVLFAAEAARRWTDRGIVPVSVHPGTVSTRLGHGSQLLELWQRLPVLRPAEQGAGPLVLLTESTELEPGCYYRGQRPRQPSRTCRDPRLAQRLWEASLHAVGLD